MDNKQMNQLLRLVLLVVATTFAPIWIPVAVITVVPTFLILAEIISTIALGITTVLTIILGTFGIPLLFSTTVTAGMYMTYKAFVKIAVKAQCFLFNLKQFLNFLVKFNLKQFLNVAFESFNFMAARNYNELPLSARKLESKGLPIVNRFVANGKREQLVYEEESETESETVVSRAGRPRATHVPFSKTNSIPLFDLSDVDDGDEIEIIFNSVEELHSVIYALCKSARNCAVLCNVSRRNTVR
ncbi:Hypothetical predicted protein [Paramuricea clavata]|uniref:Uncharacterized protein n=1 Tax=Paramuricea clavata TaxID=317549 RepID=A0A6S7LQT4_PARCT|nr:Hypothetical predicted protein [Paramuricea clavata]